MGADRVVVALDVDDVLNFDGGPVSVNVHVAAAEHPDSPFVPRPADRTLRLSFDPEVSAWVADLQTRADVVWVTTWEELANTHVAPALGIPPMPVALTTQVHPVRFGYARNGDAGAWKAEFLRDTFPGRPLCWLDDLAGAYDPRRITPQEARVWSDWRVDDMPQDPWMDDDIDRPVPAPTLVIAPAPGEGLTPAYRERVDAFVADPYGFDLRAGM